MDDYIQIKDHPSLVRDPHSKAILNTDSHALNAYEMQKRRMESAKEAMDEVADLKREVGELKALLISFINNLHNDQSTNSQ